METYYIKILMNLQGSAGTFDGSSGAFCQEPVIWFRALLASLHANCASVTMLVRLTEARHATGRPCLLSSVPSPASPWLLCRRRKVEIYPTNSQ